MSLRILSTVSVWQYHRQTCDRKVIKMNFGSRKVRKIISTIIILIIVLSMIVPMVLSAIIH